MIFAVRIVWNKLLKRFRNLKKLSQQWQFEAERKDLWRRAENFEESSSVLSNCWKKRGRYSRSWLSCQHSIRFFLSPVSVPPGSVLSQAHISSGHIQLFYNIYILRINFIQNVPYDIACLKGFRVEEMLYNLSLKNGRSDGVVPHTSVN